jgi:predicted amidohydrolase
MTNIYEQPWLLLIVSGGILPAVFVIRAVFPQRFKWLWLLPLFLAASAFAIDYFVKTDSEKVRAVLAEAAKAVEKEDVEALKPLFSDDYRDSFHPSREAILNSCKWWLSGPVIEKNVLRIVSLKVELPRAEAVFTVRVVFDPKGPVFEYRKLMLFKLRADFRKQGSGWYISRMEVIEIDLQPAGWQQIQGVSGEIF